MRFQKFRRASSDVLTGEIGTLHGMCLVSDSYDPEPSRLHALFNKRKKQRRQRTGRRK